MTGRLIIIAAGAFALVVYCSFYFGRVTFGVDTTTYLQWHPWVPLGYPMFLSAIKTTIGLRWAGAVQMALLVTACTFVALSVHRMTGRWFTGALTLLLLLSHTEVFHLQGVLFSEALFIPLLMANVGAAIFLISTNSRRSALAVAGTAATAMLVRPAGYFVVAGIAFLLLCKRSRRVVIWLGLPFPALIVGTFVVNAAVRGSAEQSQTGRVLFPHVAFLFDPNFASAQTREFAAAIENTMKSRRIGYEASRDRAARIHFSMFDYNKRINAFDAALDDVCRAKTKSPCASTLKEQIQRELFFSTIRHRPADYLSLVSEGLIEAWRRTILDTWSGFYHVYRAEAASYPQRLEQIKAYGLPLTPDDIRLRPELTDGWQGSVILALDSIRIFVSGKRCLIALIGLISFGAMFVAVFSRSRHWLALGYCGVIIHGSMCLTASVTVFIPRYALPIDPVILVAGVIMMDGLLAWALTAMRTGLQVYRGRTAK